MAGAEKSRIFLTKAEDAVWSYERKFNLTYLGKIFASNTTVLIPSRASTQAAYEPAGPPPITNTEVVCGIYMVFWSAMVESLNDS